MAHSHPQQGLSSAGCHYSRLGGARLGRSCRKEQAALLQKPSTTTRRPICDLDNPTDTGRHASESTLRSGVISCLLIWARLLLRASTNQYPWSVDAEGFDDPRCILATLASQDVSRPHILVQNALEKSLTEPSALTTQSHVLLLSLSTIGALHAHHRRSGNQMDVRKHPSVPRARVSGPVARMSNVSASLRNKSTVVIEILTGNLLKRAAIHRADASMSRATCRAEEREASQSA